MKKLLLFCVLQACGISIYGMQMQQLPPLEGEEMWLKPMTPEEKHERITALLEAAHMGDLARIDDYLKAQTAILGRNGRGQYVNVALDINAQDERGWTALMKAAQANKNGKAVQFLLDLDKKGVASKTRLDLDRKNNDGETALMIAVKHDYPENVRRLLDAGASLSMTDKKGKTAEALVSGAGSVYTMQDLFEKKRAFYENELNKITYNGGPAALAFIKEHIPKIFTIQMLHSKGSSAFIAAASAPTQKSKIDIMKELLAAGVDPDATGYGGITALHYAVAENNKDLVKVLLEAGAHFDMVAKDYGTARKMAEERDRSEIIALFETYGKKRSAKEEESGVSLPQQDIEKDLGLLHVRLQALAQA